MALVEIPRPVASSALDVVAMVARETALGHREGLDRVADEVEGTLSARRVDLLLEPGRRGAVRACRVWGQIVVVALVVVYTPRMARLVRGKALLIREMPYVEAVNALGARLSRVLGWHVLPNAMPEIIVQGSFIFGYAILDEATLSFLGVGPPPPAASWGNMLAEARYLIRDAFWISFFPGLLIGVAVLATNILGDGIRDRYDPRKGE
jgi:ABC-type dipeptide/oligopeptide/nickel transport system permease subunit